LVVADPAAELLALVTGPGDPPPTRADPVAQRAAELVRRRFGLSLPPPFVGDPAAGEREPVRPAVPTDAAAIAAVKWRAFGSNYRGILPDDFLDGREIVPPASFWQGRAMLPPTRRHKLWVWGRPGVVFGYADTGPVHPDDAEGDHADAGELYELYVDPGVQGRGGGTRLLYAVERSFEESGWTRAELTTITTNHRAQAFYEAQGWSPTGDVVHVDLGVVSFDECRYARALPGDPP
jgi:ribosomal protein S18 acetylase RimI-like enzyme